jgi:hypothetical protein
MSLNALAPWCDMPSGHISCLRNTCLFCPCELSPSRLFLAALLDALAASVQRALAAGLLGQLLASLLVCRKAVRFVPRFHSSQSNLPAATLSL